MQGFSWAFLLVYFFLDILVIIYICHTIKSQCAISYKELDEANTFNCSEICFYLFGLTESLTHYKLKNVGVSILFSIIHIQICIIGWNKVLKKLIIYS